MVPTSGDESSPRDDRIGDVAASGGDRGVDRDGGARRERAIAAAAPARRPAAGRSRRPRRLPQWDRWPYQRIGVRAYMRSTYDRTGGNDAADASATSSIRRPTTSTSRSTSPAPASSTSPATTTGTAARGTTWSTARTTSSRRPAPPIRASRSRARCSCPRQRSRAAHLDLVDHQGRRPVVGADPVRAVVPHGVLAHALRHGLLHLPPVRRRARRCRSRSRAWDGRRRRTPTCSSWSGAPAATSRRRRERGVVEDAECELDLPAGRARSIWRSAGGPRMIRALELSVPASEALALLRRAPAHHLGRSRAARRSTRRSRCSSAPARSTTATTASTWSRRSPASSGTQGDRVHLRVLLPDAVLPLGARSSWSAPATAIDDVRCARAPRAVHAIRPTTSATSTPPTAIIRRPRPGKDLVLLDTARNRRRRRLVGQLRRHDRSSSRTTPCSTRSKAIRASSSTTARRRRRRAPAPRSGAAAATTGAGAP